MSNATVTAVLREAASEARTPATELRCSIEVAKLAGSLVLPLPLSRAERLERLYTRLAVLLDDIANEDL